MFDPKKTLQLVSGAMRGNPATWRDYLAEAGDWKKTLLELTLPLIVVSAFGGYLVALVMGGDSLLSAYRPSLPMTLLSVVFGVVAIAAIAAIFSAIAGAFGGQHNFPLGLAAVSLAFVPGYLGQIITWLPWIGGLLAFVLMIYSLVLLWRIIPLYLAIPDNKRVAHFVVSLLASIVTMFVISYTLMPQTRLDMQSTALDRALGGDEMRDAGESITMRMARSAKLLSEANDDQYTPPANGKLSEAQVRNYVAVATVVNEGRKEALKKIQEISAQAEQGGQRSMQEIHSMMQSTRDLSATGFLEIEAVKSAGGNWAEYQWIRQTLQQATRQQDKTEASAHNFALYRKYEEQLYDAMSAAPR